MPAATIVEPATEQEVADVLREASRAHRTVEVRGGATKLDWGGPPPPCDIVLSTRRLDAFVEHQPGDLICVAGAGMRLEDLRSALAATPEHRQALTLDPPCPSGEATLGGITATGTSGRLRPRYGTMRDLLIGVRFVLADGTIGHAGGKVVKNVAGYDVGKLLTGSLGTLAVITQVALRLHPIAAASRLVVLEQCSAEQVAEAVATLRRLPVTPDCVDIVWPERLCAIQVDGSAAGAEHQATLIAAELGGRVVNEAERRALVASLASRPWQTPGVVAGIAAPRARLAALIAAGAAHADELVVRGPLAVAEARVPEDRERVLALRAAIDACGGHMTLHRAPASFADLAWPPVDSVALELMRAVKRSLDPGGVLAPGRFIGGI